MLVRHIWPHTSHLTPHTSHLIPYMSHLTPHTYLLTCHTSHLASHTSHLTLHTSHLTFYMSHLTPHTSTVPQVRYLVTPGTGMHPASGSVCRSEWFDLHAAGLLHTFSRWTLCFKLAHPSPLTHHPAQVALRISLLIVTGRVQPHHSPSLLLSTWAFCTRWNCVWRETELGALNWPALS